LNIIEIYGGEEWISLRATASNLRDENERRDHRSMEFSVETPPTGRHVQLESQELRESSQRPPPRPPRPLRGDFSVKRGESELTRLARDYLEPIKRARFNRTPRAA
jgi:hypothetical protein